MWLIHCFLGTALLGSKEEPRSVATLRTIPFFNSREPSTVVERRIVVLSRLAITAHLGFTRHLHQVAVVLGVRSRGGQTFSLRFIAPPFLSPHLSPSLTAQSTNLQVLVPTFPCFTFGQSPIVYDVNCTMLPSPRDLH